MIDFNELGKCDQIAFYAHNKSQADAIKAMFGLLAAEWIEDTVLGVVHVKTQAGETTDQSKGHLQFNYGLGIELEILTYLEGPHWHRELTSDFIGGRPFLSHIGFHIPDDAEMPDLPAPLVQEMRTLEHTNEYVVSRQRTYHYRIYDTRKTNGVYTKLIKRIQPPLPEAGCAPINGADILEAAAKTFRERNAVYGDNYLRVGGMMAAMFPDGVNIKTAHDWNRMHILMLDMVKKSRYAVNWYAGGHEDSVLDATVYSAMLAAIDKGGPR